MSEKKNNKKKKKKLILVQENGVRTNSLENYTGLGTCIFFRFHKNKKTQEKYYGHFLEGKKHGYGQYIYYNGDVYKGTDDNESDDNESDDNEKDDNENHEEDKSDSELFKKNKFSKELMAHIKNMNKKKKEKKKIIKLPLERESCYYYGNYINGLKHNEGMMVYENGDVYIGMWKFGEKNGHGKYIYKKCKSILEGNWVEGYLSYGKWTLPNGIYFVGRFRQNKPTGEGTWIFNDKTQVNVFYHEINNEV
ncbi:hypothetical protein PFBG_02862 [Plasmodium falciparum 7G8]|uniref:MORN repeat protein n=1 Tax=Plasmodium falciparum (isolate 7G8) TaxID=57266 RepID=W7F762_PLAF8|nr:hypothetical protein PFBG_02862 [Plasmodium falciparum 7G8]